MLLEANDTPSGEITDIGTRKGSDLPGSMIALRHGHLSAVFEETWVNIGVTAKYAFSRADDGRVSHQVAKSG